VDAGSLLEGLRRDTQRHLYRARNGIRYATGGVRPESGLTPKQVVWSRGKAVMWRYDSDQRTRRTPVVVVYSILGRSYILDLRPGTSFVQWLLDAGLDVYLVDFGIPDHVDATNTLETYIDAYLPRAIEAAMEESEADSVDVLGYCFGGLLATLLVAGHPELPVQTLTVMATPIDFTVTEGGLLALKRGRLEIDDLIDDTGNVPSETVHRMFRTLKPTSGIATYAMLWERLWSDEFVEGFQAMSQWAADQVPFPGATARQCLDLLVRRNLLTRTGRLPLGRRKVRLSDIKHPLLNIYAEHDHIVSPASSLALNRLVSSEDITTLRVPAGHIGLAASRSAVRTTIPGLVAWLGNHGS